MFRGFRASHRYFSMIPAPKPGSEPGPRGPRRITVLHVEDYQLHRTLVARHLRNMKDFEFTFLYAAREDEAVDLFLSGPVGLVVLDYYLEQGDGCNCLRRLRSIDPHVPVIAVCGGTNQAILDDLLSLDIDDYINKRDVTERLLTDRVRSAIERTDSWRDSAASRAAVHGPAYRDPVGTYRPVSAF